MQKLYEAVLGEKNSAYYLSKFQKFDQQPSGGLQASWNWTAFFCTGLWTLYRKMYGWFFVLWCIFAINHAIDPNAPVLSVVSSIIFGIFANSLYHRSVKKKIVMAQLTIKDEAQLIEFLRKKGGVNTWVVWFVFGAPVVGIVLSIIIPVFADHKIINKVSAWQFIFYLLIVSAIIFAVYTYWFKKETPQKYTNSDYKETKPQNPSEKTESIPSSYIYEIIAGEMERKEYKKGLVTRAFAEANGDKEVAKSLYIKFRYAELFSQMELECKEKQRQQQMEVNRIACERTKTQQNQSIWEKDLASFSFLTNDWVVVTGICFVAFFIWFGSKSKSTPSTNTSAAIVTPAPVQNVSKATTPPPTDPYSFLDEPIPTAQSVPKATALPQPNNQATPSSQSDKLILGIQADDLYKQGRYAEALPLYQGLAEKGEPTAQFKLGDMYADGLGVVKDEAQAVVWYRKAAEQEDVYAQTILGFMYADGLGVTKDEAQAIIWYRKAAEQGYAGAQNNLGGMYSDGRGVATDKAQAVVWFRKAAEQGDAQAQYNLGLMYKNGNGVTQDYNQAVYWYRKAAEQGDANAIAALKKLGQ